MPSSVRFSMTNRRVAEALTGRRERLGGALAAGRGSSDRSIRSGPRPPSVQEGPPERSTVRTRPLSSGRTSDQAPLCGSRPI